MYKHSHIRNATCIDNMYYISYIHRVNIRYTTHTQTHTHSLSFHSALVSFAPNVYQNVKFDEFVLKDVHLVIVTSLSNTRLPYRCTYCLYISAASAAAAVLFPDLSPVSVAGTYRSSKNGIWM